MRTSLSTSLRTRTRAARLLLAAVLPLVTACVNAEEKARRDEEAMVALAREEMEAESLFLHDSLALTASFTVDTVRMLLRTTPELDERGDTVTPAQFIVRSTQGFNCLVDSTRAMHVAPGDTLRCQWAPRDSTPWRREARVQRP